MDSFVYIIWIQEMLWTVCNCVYL